MTIAVQGEKKGGARRGGWVAIRRRRNSPRKVEGTREEDSSLTIVVLRPNKWRGGVVSHNDDHDACVYEHHTYVRILYILIYI